jgi:Cupin-like domain
VAGAPVDVAVAETAYRRSDHSGAGDRTSDPDFENEARKSSHRRTMTFGQFLDQVECGQSNDVYLTANNFDAVDTRNIMSVLADDFRPVPPYLTDCPSSAFLWLGKGTLTPVHHDTTMNLMCQLMAPSRCDWSRRSIGG